GGGLGCPLSTWDPWATPTRLSERLHFQSGSSGCFRSQSGRALRTGGWVMKFHGGGGDVVAHSSVQASQGSLPARSPVRSERNTLTRKTSTPTPRITAPTVCAKLIGSQPGSGA